MPERYKWQIEAKERFKDECIGGLDASCGLGKTLCLTDLIKHKKMPVIVIAPKTICEQWKESLVKEKIEDKDIWVFDQQSMSKNKKRYQDSLAKWINSVGKDKILIMPTQNFSLKVKDKKNPSIEKLPFAVQLMLGKFGKEIFVILDESSWIKSSSLNARSQSIRSKMIIFLGDLVTNKQIATGTLITKSPLNAYNQARFLSREIFPESPFEFFNRYTITKTYYFGDRKPTVSAISRDDFEEIRKYCQSSIGLSEFNDGKEANRDSHKMFDMMEKYHLDYSDIILISRSTKYWPYKNLDELYERLDKYIYRVKREDVFDISKDRFVYEPIIRNVTLSDEQIKVYRQIVKSGFTDNFYLGKAAGAELLIRCQDICNGQEPIKDENNVLSYRSFKENPKLEGLMELLSEIDEDEQVVVWSSRIIGINIIKERLKKEDMSYVIYTGEQNTWQKQKAEQKFLNKEARIFLANPAAAGFGLDSLRDCHYAVWFNINESVEQYHQAQHRILRGESKEPKFAYSIICKDTAEERQFERIKMGEEFLKRENTIRSFDYGN